MSHGSTESPARALRENIMAVFNVNEPQTRDGEKDWVPLATGQYTMQIAEAKIEPSPFANDDGEFPDRLSIRWQLAEWNEDYEDAGYMKGQTVFQQFNPWYGDTKKGPSKFKVFIDDLLKEQLIPAQFTIADGDIPGTEGDLVGITRRVMVENYAKTMGPNKGQPGNRVLAVTGIKAARPQAAQPTPFKAREISLDEVDAAPAGGDIEAMTMDELVGYATHLASQLGKTRNDWRLMTPGRLTMHIRDMQAEIIIKTPATVDEDMFASPF
jgi:hypothetical protein